MNKKLILLIFAMAFLAINLVHAETYPYGKGFNYNRVCLNNGTYCDSTFNCNVTIQAPDGSISVNNQQMVRNGSFYSYNVPAQLVMGVYPPVIMMCNSGNVAGADTNVISITADGNPYNQFPIVYVIVILAFILIVLDKPLRNLFELHIPRIFSGILFMIGGILVLWPGFNYTNWSTLDGFALGLIFIGIGAILISKELEEYA